MEDWSRQKASECIEELGQLVDGKGSFEDASQLQLAGGAKSRAGGLDGNGRARMGLAAKLVHHRWVSVGQRPINGSRGDFVDEVIDVYGLLDEAERRLVAGGGA